MSDREMRELLHQVMADIEEGRVGRKRLRRRRLGRLLAPPLLAASLGLAGCDDTSVGYVSDATAQDTGPVTDAVYMAPFDAAVDSGPEPPYMAPPYDAGPQPDYMSPFDGGVEEEDGGAVPLYMGPPPMPDEDGDSEEDSE